MSPVELELLIRKVIGEGLQLHPTDYLLIVTISLIAGGVGAYLGAYLKRRGENLATKEDIGEITKHIESVRHEYTERLEHLKAGLFSKLHIHQVRYEKEFAILLTISEKVVELRDASLNLRPSTAYEQLGANEDEIKRERLKHYHAAARSLYKEYEAKRPFFPEEIYEQLKILDNTIWHEVVQYKNRDYEEGKRGYDPNYWEKAEENAEKINEVAEGVFEAIQRRTRAWERLDLQY